MQQHRASFTSSRFSRPTAEDTTTVYSYEPLPEHGPAYEGDVTYSDGHFNNDHYTGVSYDDIGRDYAAYSAMADDGYSTSYEYPDATGTPAEVASVPETSFAAEPQPDASLPTVNVAPVARRRGAHRIPAPPTALKGRAAVLAVAAGAVVAAGQAVLQDETAAPVATSEYALAAGDAPAAAVVAATAVPQAAQFAQPEPSSSSTTAAKPQILSVAPPVDLTAFNDLLAKGQRFSEEREAREAAARRPMFALPAVGTYTSNFGQRWGVMHAGVDVANAIGTPIYAVADGVVVDSGPAAGFGMWVRLEHADGTITVYGHIDSSDVTVGQQVMAGDQIARMGNRGFSTGPHLHFEVHLPGDSKIDPIPWLASRGISLGPERD